MPATPQEIAWVNGVGAIDGLGSAVARRFAQGGYRVALSGRSPQRLAAVAEHLREQGLHAFAVPLDAGDEQQVLQGAAQVREAGALKVAVFNVGNSVAAPSLALSAELFEQTWRAATLGGFLFAREATQLLLANAGGSLLFTGATASLRGKPPFAAFAAAKAGLRSLSQTFAREFGPQGVHVAHVVIDGGIAGERLRTHAPQRFAQLGSEGTLQLQDIAEAYWYLHRQPRSAWTQELDLRPYQEPF